MNFKSILIGIFSLAIIGVSAQSFAGDAEFKSVKKGSDEEKAILSLFSKAMKAVADEDTGAVMNLYAKGYLNAGYRRAEMRKSWNSIFDAFNEIKMEHHVYNIQVTADGKKALMRCGGVLSGIDIGGFGSLASEDESIIIDTWTSSEHVFIKEDGQWKIFGNQVTFDLGQERHVLF